MSTPPQPDRKSAALSNPSPSSPTADQPLAPKGADETKRPTDSVPMISGTFANLPMRFGRYQVKKLLGRGAMGAVYLAEDTQLEREVALKIPKLSGSGAAKLLQRLKTEAKAAAQIEHPCLCPVYDTGEIDGTPFIAMQYIEGDTLKDVLEKQPKTPQEAVALVIHLAEGLAEAHSKGIYHRDLKPENIKVNRRGLPIIMDFGLAKLTSTLSTDAGKTQRGTILGSPAYMSPEQAGGKLEEIDHRSDLYALGVILYEMLTGQRPFSGSALQVMGQKSVADAPSVLTVSENMDPALAAVCDKMIAKRREDRYPSASEVVSALQLIQINFKAAAIGSSASWNVVPPVLSGIPVFDRDDDGTSSIITRQRKRRPPQRRAGSSGMMEAVHTKYRSVADWWHGQSVILRWSVLGGTGAVLLFAAIMLSFRTQEGTLVLEVNETGATVFIDGQQATVKWDSGQKEAAISVRPGERQVEVKKDGFAVAGKTLLFKEGERIVFKVQLKSEPDDKSAGSIVNKSRPASDKPLPTAFKNSIGMELVAIPTGEFQMGSPDAEEGHLPDEKQHLVKITKALCIGKLEVTKGQFQKFVDATGYKTDAEKDGYGGMGFTGDQKSPFAQGPFSWRNPYFEQPEDHPVSIVTWNDAVEFCKWLSKKEAKVYRLPTEAEWEYACRAGTTTRWSGGNDDRVLERSANIADASFRSKLAREIPHKPWNDGYPFTAPVGNFAANSFGLHDMHGNAWEWCNDWYDPKYYEHAPVNDPQGPNSGTNRVCRGGCWWDVPSFSRTAGRYAYPPLHRNLTLGFRVVCETDTALNAAGSPKEKKSSEPQVTVLNGSKIEPGAQLPIDQWIDVLSTVKLPDHVYCGTWERQKESLVCASSPDARLIIPVAVRGSYEINCDFTRFAGGSVVLVYLPVGQYACTALVSGWGGESHGLIQIDGQEGRQRSTTSGAVTRPGNLNNGERYRFHIEVTSTGENATVMALLNGRKIIDWKGRAAQLSLFPLHAIPYPQALGVLVHVSTAEIHNVELRLKEGCQAYRLGDDWKNPLMVVANAPPAAIADKCVTWKGHKYFISEKPMTMLEAQQFAKQFEGRLLTISSKDEEEFILKNSAGRLLWMAGWRSPENKQWRDERNRPIRFQGTWCAGQPDLGYDDRQILIETGDKNQGWHDSFSWATSHACLEWGDEYSDVITTPGFKNSLGMEFVQIPAGEFQMGSPESEHDRSPEETPHKVLITKAFSLGKHEVTQAAWKSVMNTEPWKGQKFVKEGYDYPATYVSWEDAVEFCKKLSRIEGKSYRLPTEAEWEYACRGGKTTRFSFGNDYDSLGDYAWFGAYNGGSAKNESSANRVGMKLPNAFGLFDMHGNVWEWCSDWYEQSYYAKSPVSDPQGAESGVFRVYRGGCWDNKPMVCRSAYRDRNSPPYRNFFLGFRVVCSPSPTDQPPSLPKAETTKSATRAQGIANQAPGIKNSIGMKLLSIPAGEFQMGSTELGGDAKVQHQVRITKPFFLGECEVTQAQWKAVMRSEPWKGKDLVKEGGDYPATHVSWENTQEFCKRLGNREKKLYRLPTEAEWEYACRGGTTTRYYFGNDERVLDDYEWIVRNVKDGKFAQRVGQKKSNPFGLHDISGNLWEWCNDWYSPEYDSSSPVVDPQGPKTGSFRVLRGGSWGLGSIQSQSAYRNRDLPTSRTSYHGFRVICEANMASNATGHATTAQLPVPDVRREWIGERARYLMVGKSKWNEIHPGGVAAVWLEVIRTSEYVESYDENRKLWGRFYADRLEVGTDRTKLVWNMGGGWKR